MRSQVIYSVAARSDSVETTVLPGGDAPVVDVGDLESERGHDERTFRGVPLVECECGGGIGCWAGRTQVGFADDTVYWTIDAEPDVSVNFAFPRWQYREAIRQLLELLGEAPVLIDETRST